MKRLFCALLLLGALPSWGESISLTGNGGHVSFIEWKGRVCGNGSIIDFSEGTQSFPAIGDFSFFTGRLASVAPGRWFYRPGGQILFSAGVDFDSDHDKHFDKNDFKGNLFTGTFKNAEILKTGKNTFTLEGQVWLTVSHGLAKEPGMNIAPFLANIIVKFTDTCNLGPCKANIISARVFTSSAPEPTAFVLLGLGMIFAGLGHTTLRSFFRPHA